MEKNSPIIEVESAFLNYRVFLQRSNSIKGALISRIKGGEHAEVFPAIKSLDLKVMHGESVAIMGRNGSGKSTLLKLIAGVFDPSAGHVRVSGKIAALLELGAGFSLDLTGIENIFLNAALLGQKKEVTQKKLQSIIDFSELGRFIDSPLRHYSSGMYMRLGFSVAIHSDVDIILLDEGVAVGDAGFQAKCYKALQEKRKRGATMLMVSHTPKVLKGLCQRGIILSHGQIIFDGEMGKAIWEYERHIKSLAGH